MGYSPCYKGYRCQATDGRVYISRHVTFHENEFLFKTLCPKSAASIPSISQSSSKLLIMTPVHTAQGTPVVNVPMVTRVNSLNEVSVLSVDTLVQSPCVSFSSRRSSFGRPHVSSPSPAIPVNSYAMVTRSKASIFKSKAYLSNVACLLNDTLLTSMKQCKMSVGKQRYIMSYRFFFKIKHRLFVLCLLIGRSLDASGCLK